MVEGTVPPHPGLRGDLPQIFKGYDFAPSLVNFRGVKLYANVSQEYMLAMDLLMNLNLVAKLKLNTKYYDNVTAYSVTEKGMVLLSEFPDRLKKQIDEPMKCPKCDQDIKVRFERRKSFITCPKCDHWIETGFFHIENIPYHSTAYFSRGGR